MLCYTTVPWASAYPPPPPHRPSVPLPYLTDLNKRPVRLLLPEACGILPAHLGPARREHLPLEAGAFVHELATERLQHLRRTSNATASKPSGFCGSCATRSPEVFMAKDGMVDNLCGASPLAKDSCGL